MNGGDAPGIGFGDLTFDGGKGGTQTVGGAGGAIIGSDPPQAGNKGIRGVGGDAPTDTGAGALTGAGGGGGGFFGGGSGSQLSGGGGGSGFGPEGTKFGTDPATPAPFTAAALPDGEVVIIFVIPKVVAPEGPGQNPGKTPEPGNGGAGKGPCDDVTRLAVTDRVPQLPLGC
jgi:hypothetical protein